MAGLISDLGLTFGGAKSNLSSDTIEKLKQADKSVMLDPTKKELENIYKQQKDHKILVQKLGELRTAAEAFSDERAYLKRKTTVTGDGAQIDIASGTALQETTIKIKNIATKSVLQSKGFDSLKSLALDGKDPSKFELFTGEKGDKKLISIDVTAQMTISDLKDAINEQGNGKITASLLNTGGDKPYTLIIKSLTTGKAEKITASSDKNTLDLGLETIQEARDAKIVYDGLEISRPTNTITDLYPGVKLTLLKDDSTVHFKTTQDLDKMVEDMQKFVNKYNETMKEISRLTEFNEDDKNAGTFQGNSAVNSIQSDLNKILFAVKNESNHDYEGHKFGETKEVPKELEQSRNLTHFGLELTKEGFMIFKSSEFQAQVKKDPNSMQELFFGKSKIVPSIANSSEVGAALQPSSRLAIYEGAIKINGVSIGKINMLGSNTSVQNAQALVSAINEKSKETSVTATLIGNSGQISLTDKTGKTFKLEVDSAVSKNVGLNSGTFVGQTSDNFEDGIFKKVDTFFKHLYSDSNSDLGLMAQSLKKSETRLTEELQSTLDRINAKYEVMAQQFIAYNRIISSFEASFKSIQMQIDAMNNK